MGSMRLLFFIATVPQVQCNRPQQTQASLISEVSGHFVATSSTGKKGKCPRFQPELDEGGGSTPSIVKITIKSAKNLPKSWFFSRPDPYVEFWMGEEGKRQSWIRKNLLPGHKSEKYWRARTPALSDNIHPAWEWSCLMTYDSENPTFTAQLWNRNLLSRNQFLGKVTGNLLEILDKEDRHNDGEIDHNFPIMRKKKGGKKSKKGGDDDNVLTSTTKDGEEWEVVMGNSGSSKNLETTLSVKFELIREKTRYSLTRGSGNHLYPDLLVAGAEGRQDVNKSAPDVVADEIGPDSEESADEDQDSAAKKTNMTGEVDNGSGPQSDDDENEDRASVAKETEKIGEVEQSSSYKSGEDEDAGQASAAVKKTKKTSEAKSAEDVVTDEGGPGKNTDK